MTKERRRQLIVLAIEDAIGTIELEGSFDKFLDFLSKETDEVIDFRYDDLSSEELSIVDEMCFVCEECGWTCDIGDLSLIGDSDDNICDNCARDHDIDDEYDDEDDDY